MEKVRLGVLGGGRGVSMINFCTQVDNAEVVAICDFNKDVLDGQRELNKDCPNITYYDNFDEFINHDMDAVVLANYATEHAPFAIRCLNKGLHVFSECLPCQTMKEAVELIEAVERSGKIYDYGENYCYMQGPLEMKKLYREGKVGEFEFGEGNYIHNCEPDWPYLAYGDKNHWRNNMYSTFYCTHSIGPLIHITGLRPVSVIGLEGAKNERALRIGRKGGSFGIEMITLENGGIIRSVHGELYTFSVWYNLFGSKGQMETAEGLCKKLRVTFDEYSGAYKMQSEFYEPKMDVGSMAGNDAHGGGDFYSMYHFIKAINGDKDADFIDVYEAMDMFLPGLFAYRSILKGGQSVEIPNLRDKKERDKWRNDTACTDPKVAGDQLLPTTSKGTPDIDESVYKSQYAKYEATLHQENNIFAHLRKLGRKEKK